jgi:hypothetical protein
MATIPVLDTHWRRKPPGREIVAVRRTWFGMATLDRPDHWVVRTHPVRGGKPLVADAQWFIDHYDPAPEP